ncbi:MAG: heparin lyase I family protein [Bacteroidota bacterium]
MGGSSPTTVNFSTFPYTITGLTSGSTYDVSVKAKDAATNQSTASNVITRKTLAPNLLFDEGFEDCNPWDNWTTGQDAGHAWSRQQSGTHANEGTHSFRAEVRSGCDGFVSSGYRSEILPAGMTDEGERWYGFSIYFDEPYSSGNWTGSYGGHFIQWHPDNGSGSASLALWGSEGEWDLVTNPEGNSNTRHHHTGTPITRGWHHFVIYVDWSSTAGKVKVWIDGSVVFDLVHNTHSSWYGPSGTESGGPELLDWNEEGRYLKFGINRWGECSTPSCPSGSQGPCDIWILYYDNLRIGDASADYNDVAPATGGSFRVANPVKPVAPVVTKPANYTLGQNYPNPFNKQSSIQFTLPKAEKVNLSLIDLNGRVVKVLMNASKDAGTHTVSFDAGSLAKGVYYYKIKAGNFTDVKKLTIQ